MKVGDFARYRNTGTVGKVLEVADRPEGQWVLLDTYGLYYEASTLDPAQESEYKAKVQDETTLERQLEQVERLKETISEAERNIGRITIGGS